MNTSTLSKLPQSIAEQSYKLLSLDSQIKDARELVAKFESAIDAKIAFGEFKNAEQRKAAKAAMSAESLELQEALHNLRWLDEDRERQSVELNLLRDRFSIAKLEAREKIAKMESLAG